MTRWEQFKRGLMAPDDPQVASRLAEIKAAKENKVSVLGEVLSLPFAMLWDVVGEVVHPVEPAGGYAYGPYNGENTEWHRKDCKCYSCQPLRGDV